MPDLVPVRRALLSVSDKTDLLPFARKLAAHGVTLISTGGTAKTIADAGIPVTPIEQVTGFPEMMDGRVKTLHPKIHGGLLALRDDPTHAAAMRQHDIAAIDLVCVNLYPFEQTIAKPDVKAHDAIENIDIGGPSMIRSAAKNHGYVAVVTDPTQYDAVIRDIDGNGGATTMALRKRLAAAAFARTARYDLAIAQWMARHSSELPDADLFPDPLVFSFTGGQLLRYGENPHQHGAVYRDFTNAEPCVAAAKQLHGKELSYCNLFDADGALELVKEVNPAHVAAAAVIKHANPCGFAVADDLGNAFDQAYDGDPVAAFGGIVAVNRRINHAAALRIADGKKFLEVIVAPGFDDDALKLLKERWANVRLLAVGELPAPEYRDARKLDCKRIVGGLIAQTRDLAVIRPQDWKHAAGPAPSADDLRQLTWATLAVKHLKSNAVCLVRDDMLVGAGAGQMDRLTSCRLAIAKAGDRAQGAYVGSDAFFPFRDGPDELIAAGVKAIAQPGGSKRDEDTLAACNEAGVTLMLTGLRHFRH
jgi:phosphoribosylaminoimidazolecarboxamide formyltransferase/IMP cyclohydrolase